MKLLKIESSSIAKLKSVETRDGGIDIGSESIYLSGNISTDDQEIAGSAIFHGTISLTGDTSIDTDSESETEDGNIVFNKNVNADSTNNDRKLVITAGKGTTDFQDDIGTLNPLKSLEITSSEITNIKNIKTRDGGINIVSKSINLSGNISTNDNDEAGEVTFEGDLTLFENSEINTNADITDANISFKGNIDSNATENEINRDKNYKAVDLNIIAGDATAKIDGNVGSAAELNSLVIKSGSASLKEINTLEGGVDIEADQVTLDGNISTNNQDSAGSVKISGQVILAGITKIETDSAISDADVVFENDINADLSEEDIQFDVIADFGKVTFNGDIGTTNALKSVNVSSETVNIKSVNTRGGAIEISAKEKIHLSGNLSTNKDLTAGDILIDGSVVLEENSNINTNSETTDANITFKGSINADNTNNSRTLKIDSGSGQVDLHVSEIGMEKALALIEINSSEVKIGNAQTGHAKMDQTGIDINAEDGIYLFGNLSTNALNNAGKVNLNGPVILNSDTKIEINTNASGQDADVLFTNKINADSKDNNRQLSIDAGGAKVSVKDIGGDEQLYSIDVFSEDIELSGDIQTTGRILLNGNTKNEGFLILNTSELTVGKITASGIELIADEITLNNNCIANEKNSSGEKQITIKTKTPGQEISLGGMSSANKMLYLSSNELKYINADTLIIDNNGGGGILINGSVNSEVNKIVLKSTDNITGNGEISVEQLLINSDGQVNLDGNNEVDFLASQSSSFAFVNNKELEINSVKDIEGVKTMDGNISIKTISNESNDVTGDLLLSSDIVAGSKEDKHIYLDVDGNLNGSTPGFKLTGQSANIQAKTIGISENKFKPVANVTELIVDLSETTFKYLDAGNMEKTKRLKSARVSTPGTFIIDDFQTYFNPTLGNPREVLSTMSTLSIAQDKLEKFLKNTSLDELMKASNFPVNAEGKYKESSVEKINYNDENEIIFLE